MYFYLQVWQFSSDIIGHLQASTVKNRTCQNRVSSLHKPRYVGLKNVRVTRGLINPGLDSLQPMSISQ